jgi:outer membrane receptor protein involved in Fe transport
VQPTNFVTNAGAGEVYGLELEANGRWNLAGGDLSVQAGGSRQYGKFTAGPLKGVRVPQTPNWLANANLNYIHPLVRGSSWFLNANYSAQWGGLQDVTLPPFAIDDRQLIDLRGGVRKDGLELAAYVKNATDEVYAVFRAPSNIRWPDDRRNWGLQLRYRW